MKTLKFDHEQIEDIKQGIRTSTWRLFFDDKNIKIGDTIGFIDSSNGVLFGNAEVLEINIKRIKSITYADYDKYEKNQNEEEIINKFKKYYGPTVNSDSIVMMIEFRFDPANQNSINNKQELPSKAKMFVDGGSRGNPGHSACGYVFMDCDNQIITIGGDYLGITTNNQAEYNGLKRGLNYAIEHGCNELHVYMDSLLVVNQMVGAYKVRNRDLWPIYNEIVEQSKKLKTITFTHVPREMNKVADAKVNQILDEKSS